MLWLEQEGGRRWEQALHRALCSHGEQVCVCTLAQARCLTEGAAGKWPVGTGPALPQAHGMPLMPTGNWPTPLSKQDGGSRYQ